MIERIGDPALSAAALNAALVASWDVLPALLLAYAFQSLLARRHRPEFSLRRSEAAELDRALVLYRNTCGRLQAIDELAGRPNIWRLIFTPQAEADRHVADEREDLEAHAKCLRAIIVQLRRLPLKRLRDFVRIMSLRFALGRAVVVHIAALTLFFLAFFFSEHAASADELGPSARNALAVLVRLPLDQGLFQANVVGACFATVALPLLYVLRLSALRHQFGLEFCVLKDLARSAPDQAIEWTDADSAADADASGGVTGAEHEADEWFTMLGVSPSATAEQVREAYKTLIKQTHPDLVQSLSPAIRQFAEAETKRINVAYEQALASVG
jgi:hypothetical protein